MDAKTKPTSISYTDAGVDTEREEASLKALKSWLRKTFDFPLKDGVGSPLQDFGSFANVIDLGGGNGLALSTDGVGTKALVAQMMDKYDTIGIDLVAMNVNDVLCVGARPISMLDYIAVQEPDPRLLEEIGRGLYDGAKQANITIVGGEIAQLREMIKAERENFGFDLAGMCVGIVPTDRIIDGRQLKPGDVIVGLRSNGIHSNGLTLARRALFDQAEHTLDEPLDALHGTPLGEELLKPTQIYVREILDLLERDVHVKALIHVTSDGFLNLLRVESHVGFIIEYLPDPPAIFSLIQEAGSTSDEEMFRVYNMGIGFCVIVPEHDAEEVISLVQQHDEAAYRIGRVVDQPDLSKKVLIEPKNLLGEENRFVKV